jgi:hypothetical protein
VREGKRKKPASRLPSASEIYIDGSGPVVLSEYELDRLRNIEANKEMMRKLGLLK